jgi:hypothetical protein
MTVFDICAFRLAGARAGWFGCCCNASHSPWPPVCERASRRLKNNRPTEPVGRLQDLERFVERYQVTST